MQSGASITCKELTERNGGQICPKITVDGSLDNSGTVTAGAIEFNSSSVTGSGIYKDSTLYQNRISLGELNISGNCSLIFSDGSSLGTVDLSSGSTLDFYANANYLNGCSITLKTALNGSGSVTFHSGNYHIFNSSFVLSSSVSVSADTFAVTVEDVSGKIAGSDTKALALIVDPDSTSLPGADNIPVVTVDICSTKHTDGSYTWELSPYSSGTTQAIFDLAAYKDVYGSSEAADNLSFSGLYSYFSVDAGSFLELYTISKDQLTRYVILSTSDERTVKTDSIWLIRKVNVSSATDGSGGGSIMSTNSALTGSGILGGSGAGSVSGGAGSSILTGTGISSTSGNTGTNDNTGGNSGDNGANDNTGSDNGNSGSGDNTGGDNGNSGSSDNTSGNNGNAGNTTAAAQQNIIVSVNEIASSDSVFTLTASMNGKALNALTGTVRVRFDYPAPAAAGQLFAVFRNADGSLTAYAARYDAISGQIVFESGLLGEFAVVCMDYKGELYTDEFYAFLETFASVKALA